MAAYRIILADDHVRFRGEIIKILKEISGVEVMGEAGLGSELFKLLGACQPDLVLLDISMPDLRGIQATRTIKSEYPEVKVILMVMDAESEYCSYAKAAGADGILLKQDCAGDLRIALQKIRSGQQYFPKSLKASGNNPYFSFFRRITPFSI